LFAYGVSSWLAAAKAPDERSKLPFSQFHLHRVPKPGASEPDAKRDDDEWLCDDARDLFAERHQLRIELFGCIRDTLVRQAAHQGRGQVIGDSHGACLVLINGQANRHIEAGAEMVDQHGAGNQGIAKNVQDRPRLNTDTPKPRTVIDGLEPHESTAALARPYLGYEIFFILRALNLLIEAILDGTDQPLEYGDRFIEGADADMLMMYDAQLLYHWPVSFSPSHDFPPGTHFRPAPLKLRRPKIIASLVRTVRTNRLVYTAAAYR
jgi:hypothetical protein